MEQISNKHGFTIMEILVVVIIVGIIAGFAIPNYGKSVEQGYLQDAMIQLSAIRSANQLYYAKTSTYWPPTSDRYVSAINTSLSLNIIENGLAYECDPGGVVNQTFTCTATRTGGAFTVTVDEAPLSTTNPDCSGSCP